jgi:membrane associated rhomboid family serine protease
MGIYNRDYYRAPTNSRGVRWSPDGLTPVVKYLILANVAVFLLQIFVVREGSALDVMRRYNPGLDQQLTEAEDDPEAMEKIKKKYHVVDAEDGPFSSWQRLSIVQDWCELDPNKVIYQGQVWRLLTHAFCHDRMAIWHILMNMFVLYFFGCTLESMYGSREFLFFYLTAAVVAGLAYIGLDLYTGRSIPAIGASGAVMAVAMLYTMHFPYETIMIFWLIPLQMRWVMLLYAIWDLHPVLLALAGDKIFTGIGHAAHLGGLAFGIIYFRCDWRLEALKDRIALPRWGRKRRPRLRLAPETFPEPEPDHEPALERVDELLEKIYQSGQASLTDEERTILRQASERLKNRARRD